ncbi:type II toxin-antitoxin system VapC family toxin [Desulfonatronum lacustre]|uniref:type II toxin-antitoxin system VapC family toxin n=1 Tax=Desulfonatronum lacustre TaxID=66849 RepID=UPI00048B05FD|nr:type II toxin-antitoxin system VapC family toxin [Desulfonatronum lacustre]
MRLLIDTQIFIWTVIGSGFLCDQARRTMLEAERVCVSAASIWEIAIKTKIGKLEGNPHDFCKAIRQSGFQELFVTARHAATVHDLPLYHRDPFDRILVAQAICEELWLLTADKLLKQYSTRIITVPG